MSIMDICCLSGEAGSHILRGSPGRFVVAWLRIILSDSSGGVGAKIASSPAVLISLATKRLRMRGLASSPLFVSTHLTVIGRRPILCIDSLIFLITHTFFSLKYSNSLARASMQSSAGSGSPVRSSMNRS